MMEQRQTNNGVTLTLDEYRDIGALEEALSAHADEVLMNDLTPEQQRIAQTLFRRLTERVVGRGDRRRPTKLGDVAKVAGVTNEEVAAVVEKFRRSDRSFLTPPTGVHLKEETILDITHESLITLWHTLDGWVDDEARSAAAYDRLKKTAQDWPKDAELLGGINLERAQEWRNKQKPTLPWARRYGTEAEFKQTIKFLDASASAWELHLDSEANRERIRRENEIEREKLKAKAKVARTLTLLTAALGVVAIMAATAAVYATRQSRLATRSEAEARLQESKATSALNEATQQRQEAVRQKQMAVDAAQEADRQKQRAVDAAQEAANQRSLAEKFARQASAEAELARKREHDARVAEARAIELQLKAENATLEAIVDADKARELAGRLAIARDELEKKAEEAIATAKELAIESAQLQEQKEQTEENLRLAREAQINLNVELKNNLLQTERALSTQAAFSADASRIFTFSRAEGPSVWSTAVGWPINTIKTGGRFLSAAFSRDGGRIVTAAENGEILLTDLTLQTVQRLQGIATKPLRIILSADAKRLAVLDGADGSAKIVDLISGKTLAGVSGTWSPIVNMSFSDDGKQLAVIALDGESKLVQLRRGEQVSTASLTTSRCRSTSFDLVNFSPRPDLRARLSLRDDCHDSAEKKAAGGLTPAQTAHALGPAADDAKVVDEKKSSNPIQDTLTKKDKPADPVPTATPTPSATPSPNTRSDTPVAVADQRRTETITLSIEQRQEDGSFAPLVELSSEKQLSSVRPLSLMEIIRVRGLPDSVIRKISASINGLADKLDEIKGDGPEQMEKRNKLAFDVFDQIIKELGLAPQLSGEAM